jgi:predicted lipoprotein
VNHLVAFFRRAALLALALTAGLAVAQAVPAPLPLAHPQTGAFVDGLLKALYAPAARRFSADADALADRTQAWCASPQRMSPGDARLEAARRAWTALMQSWVRLSAVPIGAQLERHSETRLDFQPLRPAALDKVVASPSAPGEWAMDRVGAQARGLPAMEYLLWKRPAPPQSAPCAYLVVLARDARDEARELALAYAVEAAASRSADQAGEWFNTYVNQWLAGMSRLRWRDLEMPVRSWGMEQAPRAASGNTALAWSTRWQALRQPSLGGPGTPAGLLPLTAYLRVRGLDASADTMQRDVGAADAALQGATPATPRAQLLDAAKRVDAVTHTISREVVGAMQIQLEFSADDGD